MLVRLKPDTAIGGGTQRAHSRAFWCLPLAPPSGGPAQCRPTGTFQPEGRHRSVPMRHSGASLRRELLCGVV